MKKENKLITIAEKKNEKFLRTPVPEYVFGRLKDKEIRELLEEMRQVMIEERGVGLSANQIGLDIRLFVAQMPNKEGSSKFYAVFNPKIEKSVKETETVEEGCLSVPGIFGPTERAWRVILSGQDKHGRQIKIKAWGLLARIFQHETDHLNGILFIDKAKTLHKETELTGEDPNKI